MTTVFLIALFQGGRGAYFCYGKNSFLVLSITSFALLFYLIFFVQIHFFVRRPANARRLPRANNTTVAGSGIGTGKSGGGGGGGGGGDGGD